MKITCLIFSAGLLLMSPGSPLPAGPAPEFKIKDEYTSKSPDGATAVEQYFRTDKDDNYIWQFRQVRCAGHLCPGQREGAGAEVSRSRSCGSSQVLRFFKLAM
jgi:hypothetical protein